MLFRLLFAAALLSAVGCNKALIPEQASFMNPLLPVGPDPWVIQKDSFYYYMHTLGNRIELRKTRSMSRLERAKSKVIWTPPAVGPNSHHLWAPELHHLNDKWYIYYSAGPSVETGFQKLFVLENSSPDPMEGEWIDKGQIADYVEDIFAIDATVLQYQNKNYLIWSSRDPIGTTDQRLYCAEMRNPWTLSSRRVLISSPTLAWEKLYSSFPKGVNEGPEILKNGKGKVFLVYSASECGTDDYNLGMLTLKDGGNPLKPSDWVKTQSPVLFANTASSAYGPGHCSFFKSPDGNEDWIIYHANSFPGQGCGNSRNPRIQKFTWDENGNPVFGQPVKIFKRLSRPSGEKD